MLQSRTFRVTTPSTTWELVHNYGVPVNADVFLTVEGVVQKAYPASMVQDDERNVLTVTWSSPQVGTVRVAANTPSVAPLSNPSWIPDDAN